MNQLNQVNDPGCLGSEGLVEGGLAGRMVTATVEPQSPSKIDTESEVAERSTEFLQLLTGGLSLVLINDYMGQNTPLIGV